MKWQTLAKDFRQEDQSVLRYVDVKLFSGLNRLYVVTPTYGKSLLTLELYIHNNYDIEWDNTSKNPFANWENEIQNLRKCW